jgi:DMSO/TMAO reductase YedYZ molybdopterin-dependent catalytic subunit
VSKIERRPELVCSGFFGDLATWAGVPLVEILDLAGIPPGAAGLRLVGADGYSALATIEMATSGKSILAYEWEGEPLPILHGFPVRAVFPDSAGSSWVKWLVRIEVIG